MGIIEEPRFYRSLDYGSINDNKADDLPSNSDVLRSDQQTENPRGNHDPPTFAQLFAYAATCR